MSVLLAVDGGQTGLRMAVVSDGAPAQTAQVDGFTPAPGDDPVAISDAVAQAHAALGLGEPVARVCLGLTGAPGPAASKERLGTLLAEQFDGAGVAFGPDMVTAHAGALDAQPGVVIAAGTGAVAFGIAADGTHHRADGLGFLLGDDGSGMAIGQAGVRAALRAWERRGPATALEGAAARFFGQLDALPHLIRASASPVADIAAFVPDVAAAARAGDAVAGAIWREAASRLVETTVAVLERTFPDAEAGSVPVSHSGRLFAARDLLLEPFAARLAARCPAARLREPAGDSLAGAARLVAHGLGRYAPLMHTTEGWNG